MTKPQEIKTHEREFWDANAERYDARLARYSARFCADLVDLMYPQKFENALDIGGGTGATALKLCERIGAGGSVTMVDLSPRVLAIAVERASALKLSNLTTRVMDAERLDFPDAAFDLVSCAFAGTAFPNIAAALSEIRRVTRPGGRVGFAVWSRADRFPLFTVPALEILSRNSDPLSRWLARMPLANRKIRNWLTTRPGPWGLSPLRFCSPGSLEAKLADAGFQDLRREVRAFPIEFQSFEEYWEAAICVAPFNTGHRALLQDAKEDLRRRIPDRRDGRVTLWNEGALILAKLPRQLP